MVDFPEYYEQMRESLRAAAAPAPAPAPAAPAAAPANAPASNVNTEAARLNPRFSDSAVYGPARPPVNRAPAPSADETRNQQAPQPPALPRPQQQQPSILDMLRQRMQTQIDDESNQRLRDIGIGMLRSNSPNFFVGLGEGLAAGEAGATSRMERLRQLADTERQQRAQQAEEQYRRDQIENERLRRANEERRINAEIARGDRPTFSFMRNVDGTGVVAVDPRDPTRTIPVPGVMLATDRTAREENALRQNARNQAQMAANQEATRRGLLGQTMSQEDIAAFRRTTEEQLLASIGLLPLPGAGTTPGTTGGGPAPSQVLQYGGPAAPAAPRTGPRISAQPPQ